MQDQEGGNGEEGEGDEGRADCSECPAGHFLAKKCDIEDGKDRECKLCSDRCGQGVVDCRSVKGGEAHCKECSFGEGIFLLDKDGDGYGECKFCRACGEDEYVKAPCSGSQDNECKKCRCFLPRLVDFCVA